MKTRQKGHFDDAMQYDGEFYIPFDTFTPGGAIANSVINAIFPLPVACKIQAVAIVQRTGANFVTALNIELGTGADAGVAGTPDNSDQFSITSAGGVTGGAPSTLAVAGNTLFGADQTVTALTADVPQTFFPPFQAGIGWNGDIIWPQNGLLTLRVVTAGAGGLVKVVLLAKCYDIKQYTPRSTTFNPATDI